eukprot:SAG11_NODE_1635_length_4539_cov_2.188514_8_plen_244_part_00
MVFAGSVAEWHQVCESMWAASTRDRWTGRGCVVLSRALPCTCSLEHALLSLRGITVILVQSVVHTERDYVLRAIHLISSDSARSFTNASTIRVKAMFSRTRHPKPNDIWLVASVTCHSQRASCEGARSRSEGFAVRQRFGTRARLQRSCRCGAHIFCSQSLENGDGSSRLVGMSPHSSPAGEARRIRSATHACTTRNQIATTIRPVVVHEECLRSYVLIATHHYFRLTVVDEHLWLFRHCQLA